MELRKQIRSLRLEHGLSQQELARKLHIDAKTVSAYETGRAVPPIYMLQSMAAVYEASFIISSETIDVHRRKDMIENVTKEEILNDKSKMIDDIFTIEGIDIKIDSNGKITNLNEDIYVKLMTTPIEKLPEGREILIPVIVERFQERFDSPEVSITKVDFVSNILIVSAKADCIVRLTETECKYVSPILFEEMLKETMGETAYIQRDVDNSFKCTVGFDVEITNGDSEGYKDISDVMHEIEEKLSELYCNIVAFLKKNMVSGGIISNIVSSALAGKPLEENQVFFLDYLFEGDMLVEAVFESEVGERKRLLTTKQYWVAKDALKDVSLPENFINEYRSEIREYLENKEYIAILNLLKLNTR